jgi:hypothetical protein
MTILALVVAAMLLAGWLWSRPGFTALFTDASGEPLPTSIAFLERVMLGGVDQDMRRLRATGIASSARQNSVCRSTRTRNDD